jgi:ribosome maturation factor RimP
VKLKGYAPLADRGKWLEGRLLGLEGGDEGSERVALAISGERVEVPLAEIASAHLVYHWEDDL